MSQDKTIFEDKDTIDAEIVEDWSDYKKYIQGKVKYKELDNGKPPINRNDLGRNCPRCQGRLEVKEVRDSGAMYLYCKSCRGEFFADDIDNVSESTDQIYRSIPLDVQQKWIRFRKEQKKTLGQN